MDAIRVCISIVLAVILIPIIVFYSVKLGTYAYYSARRTFHEEHKSNGEKERET